MHVFRINFSPMNFQMLVLLTEMHQSPFVALTWLVFHFDFVYQKNIKQIELAMAIIILTLLKLYEQFVVLMTS